MADNQRIEDLRRRVQKDPASIAFAQLAEELRRAGQCQESVDICRGGLSVHPGSLSARVPLGRALIELQQLDEALGELQLVLRSAPENLAAIRGIAEIHHRRGQLGEALHQYRNALTLARNDPDLERTVDELAREIEPQKPAVPTDGLSFEQMQQELLKLSLPPPSPAMAQELSPPPPMADTADQISPSAATAEQVSIAPSEPDPSSAEPSSAIQSIEYPARERALHTVEALERWLDAIHVTRTDARS